MLNANHDDMTIAPTRARANFRFLAIGEKNILEFVKQSSYRHKTAPVLNDDDFMTINDDYNRHGWGFIQ